MQFVKKLFTPKKNRYKSKPEKNKDIIIQAKRPPAETLTFERDYITVHLARYPRGDYYKTSLLKLPFVPQERGKEAIMEWLNGGACASSSLELILTERDRAAKQVQRGPKTHGTRETQRMLNRPSPEAVERLRAVQEKSRIALRYGAPGVAAYNFSKSLGWNQSTLLNTRPPSPDSMVDFETRMAEIRAASAAATSMPDAPFSPIDWVVLPSSNTKEMKQAEQQGRPSEYAPGAVEEDGAAGSWSPISEPGGWRDTETDQADIGEWRLDDICEAPLETGRTGGGSLIPGDRERGGDGPYVGKATAVEVTPVRPGQIRQIHNKIHRD